MSTTPRPNGTCPLCQNVAELCESHFMPAALYPPNHILVETSPTAVIVDPVQVKDYVLCPTCERLFNVNGEDEVLRWIAAKAVGKAFPLLEKMQATTPLRVLPEGFTVHSSAALGVNPDRFAYFALSILWRASIRSWTQFNGSLSVQRDLGPYAEPIRRFLLGEAPLPDNVVVVVTVCMDPESRETWFAPAFNDDYGCLTFPFLALGVIFRVWLGPIPDHIRAICCRTSAEKPLMLAYCADQTQRIMNVFQPVDTEAVRKDVTNKSERRKRKD